MYDEILKMTYPYTSSNVRLLVLFTLVEFAQLMRIYYDLHHITAELLSNVCNDIAIKPPLQLLSGEVFTPGYKMTLRLTFMLANFEDSCITLHHIFM